MCVGPVVGEGKKGRNRLLSRLSYGKRALYAKANRSRLGCLCARFFFFVDLGDVVLSLTAIINPVVSAGR